MSSGVEEPRVKKQKVEEIVTQRIKVDLTCNRDKDQYPEFSFEKLLSQVGIGCTLFKSPIYNPHCAKFHSHLTRAGEGAIFVSGVRNLIFSLPNVQFLTRENSFKKVLKQLFCVYCNCVHTVT